MPTTLSAPLTYSALSKTIGSLIHTTQRQIDSLKLKTYWQIGTTMKHYLSSNQDSERALMGRLARDLEMEQSLFYRMFQLASSFPALDLTSSLSWSHYRELLSVHDPAKRRELEMNAQEGTWSVMRLRREVFKVRTSSPMGTKALARKLALLPTLEEPKRFDPGTYAVGWLRALGKRQRKVIDFGFEIYGSLSARDESRFEAGELARWSETKQSWQRVTAREGLHFYTADVERIVDGDTLLVHLDFGSGYTKRQYLRLRAIEAEARSTPQGQRAQTFLAGKIKKEGRIFFKSRWRDAYDRYLSDVWIGHLYMNQALIDEGLAVRVK